MYAVCPTSSIVCPDPVELGYLSGGDELREHVFASVGGCDQSPELEVLANERTDLSWGVTAGC